MVDLKELWKDTQMEYVTRLLKKFILAIKTMTGIKPKVKRQYNRNPDIYNFRHTILDRLDEYFDIIKRLRKADVDSFRLHRKFGAAILPKSELDVITEDSWKAHYLYPWWKTNRPSFGAFFLCKGADEDRDGEYSEPTFICFRKFKKDTVHPDIQKGRGDIYVVMVCWDGLFRKNSKSKKGVVTEFAVALDEEANIQILKTRQDVAQTIRSKNPGHSGRFQINRKKFIIDPFFIDWADQHKDSIPDVHSYMSRIFVLAANAFSMQNSEMAKVRVRRGNTTALFPIDILYTPYFFKDRLTTTLPSGRTKPIFHIVRTHARQVSGVTKYVKTHFRGEMNFNWNGYQVGITVPGWHHLDASEFSGHAHSVADDDHRKIEGYLDSGELADALNEIEDAGRDSRSRQTR